MSDVDLFFVHTATVRTFLATTATGSKLADPVTVACFINDARDLVITSTGEQLRSTTKLYTDLANAPLFTPDSQVTSSVFGDGRTARVTISNSLDSGSLLLPDHLKVELL